VRGTDAGFAKRVMFGSDPMVWPETIERSIHVINAAPFLSDEKKRDILFCNTARFLRLPDAEIERMHKPTA
jgi:predicted TIM-barrel fold metal-dependent hydrolase